MEQNTPKFRLRLNLFDGIVLVLVLAVGAFLLWNALKPAVPAADTDTPAASTSTVQYTVRFQRWREGTASTVQAGDRLVDTIKNYELGQVLSTQIVPSQALVLDQESRQYVLADIPDCEDILVTVESPCTVSDDIILLDGGYTLRVGATAYIRSGGYMAYGPVISIEREGQK